MCAEMIREFLTFYKMEHTLSVFMPEMSLSHGFPKSRDEMARECGLSKSQDDESKPLLLTVVEKVRVGDYGPGAGSSAQKSMQSQEYSHSPNQMKPHFSQNQNDNMQDYDHTPPTTGI